MDSQSQSKVRLKEKLREQLGFLERSCQAYDLGQEDEAIRIAVGLRILFRNTRKSTSLMKHLGFEDKDMLSTNGARGHWTSLLIYKLDIATPTPISFLPVLGGRFSVVPMRVWWQSESVFEHNGDEFSREKIVCSAADKDGGAHVDATLVPFYEALKGGKHGLSINGQLEFNGSPPFPQGEPVYPENGHLALLRQFAHETLRTAEHQRWRS